MSRTLLNGVAALLVAFGCGMAGASEPRAASAEASGVPAAPMFLPMAPIAVPVFRGQRVAYHHFVGLSLQVPDAERRARLEQLMPRLRDAFLRELNGRSVVRADSSEQIDLDLMKVRLLKQAELVLGAGVVDDVLVTAVLRGS